ncbi:MAG: geranylgeranylglyceryl/heptaprenylglyceryl phosphate synthase [Saprospiraceae bacterium]|uniref:Geranylgeranylglyceryl phosphate synthase n=1 Tax=Candidatus Opimibacter skivensis TaxID=2982028 RepID=A0A9D7XMX6_9BACT|nr:geranylgeranylglyceryl/heptaprenylglyceryl phosphate synthase [Candidatus Opimibacter skivensis]
METGRNQIYTDLVNARQLGKKKLAVLIDPDQMRMGKLDQIIDLSIHCKVDYFFIGGSLLVNSQLDQCLEMIRKRCPIPLILFPGNSYQLSYHADAILFLSLVSGRNPDLLIGQHVIAAPYLKLSQLEVLPTGYMLVDGGVGTTVLYMSNTSPIPANKSDIAVCTALAAEMLGLRLIFMDAGSGATKPIPSDMIAAVRGAISIPIIVGGGIRSAEKVKENLEAGADVIVIGNAFEHDPSLMIDIAATIHEHNVALNV